MDDDAIKRLRELAERARDAEAAYVAAQRQLDAELQGNAALRSQHGARPTETMFAFVERMVSERDAAMALLRQWDELIAHQYTGSRAAMDAMHQCAQATRALLGDGGEG